MAAIKSLPVELLALIFEHLVTERHSIDLVDPSLFPCAIARVCQLWRDVVAQHPAYWKHIVFDLASEEPLFLEAFVWAKETIFEVLVFDSRYGPYEPKTDGAQRRLTTISNPPTPISADHERAMVSAITEALIPHLEWCYSLQYSMSFSDSLPEVTTILQHSSDTIRELRLDYNINNSDISTRALKYHWDGDAQFTGTVELLSIDVVAFFLMMEQLPSSLFSDYHPPPLAVLEISDYQFQADDNHTSKATSAAGNINVTDFIRYLSLISDSALDICLRGLSMAACGRHYTEAGITLEKWEIPINEFYAVDLSEDFLHHLFQQAVFDGESFTGHFKGRCIFPMNTPSLPFRCLDLHRLPLDANLPRLLTGWTGRAMKITSCPCFNDELLDMLAEGGTCMEDCIAPCLSALDIEHCDNVSRRALMNFFVKRNNAALLSSYFRQVAGVTVDGVQVGPTVEEMILYK